MAKVTKSKKTKSKKTTSSTPTTTQQRTIPKSKITRKKMPNNRSLLLELPAELRNEVYKFVAAESGAILRKGKLASRSSLTRVSRQIHEEYQSVLAVSANPLVTEVKDFDFAHVVRFLNKLSDRELNALPTLTKTAGHTNREIQVVLQISSFCPVNPEKLHSWLLRYEHPTKKGTNVKFVYTAKSIDAGCCKVNDIRERLDKMLFEVDDSRLKDELRWFSLALGELHLEFLYLQLQTRRVEVLGVGLVVGLGYDCRRS